MPLLEFEGKGFIYAHHLGVEYRNLVVDKKKSILTAGRKADIDGNLIIHGDNLHALKALMPRYAGRVNCIYIDPPYNTGNEGWVYNDRVNSPLMKRWLKENGAVDGEDPERHDKWLCMMWPRLQLLRELLAEDGVIFISIDDNEVGHLWMVMNEIFGKESFIGDFVWNTKTAPKGVPTKNMLIRNHEYIVCYRKGNFTFLGKPRDEKQFTNPDNDPRGPWKADNMKSTVSKESFDITDPKTGRSYRSTWAFARTTIKKMIEEGRIIFPSKPDGMPRQKKFLSEYNKNMPITSGLGFFQTETATNKLKEIFDGKKIYDFPKPVELIKFLIQQSTKPDSLILDSFAGSGTTAHAVLALNKEDGGNRKFILVECEDYADTITAERVRRVIQGAPGAKRDDMKHGLGGSFTFCTLGEELSIENMLTGKNLPDYDALAHHLIHVTRGLTLDKIKQGADYLYAETDDECFYLIYKPDLAFLRSKESALALALVERIERYINKKGKSALVFAPWKFMGQKELTKKRITYCQLPWAIHMMYGNELGEGGT